MSKTKLPKLEPIRLTQNISLGCDPEFFFADRRGDVVGSEKVLTGPKDGGLIIDGVQAEINPGASSCREGLASSISNCFIRLNTILQARGNDISLKMDTLIDISERELNSLSDASRRFGCAPSTNVYNEGKDKTSEIKANPATYLKRSAGGHIHLGNYISSYLDKKYAKALPDGMGDYTRQHKTAVNLERALKETPEITVPILDIIVGNTCVLLDRQGGNKERRQNYGRVGEFRIKPYGLEYRTLSNFWLRSYPLMSLVMSLSRFAVQVVSESTKENDYVKAFFDAVSRDDIVKAVNENDFDLAMKNFKAIQPIWLMATNQGHDSFRPIGSDRMMTAFLHFVSRIQEKGLEYWFPAETLKHWTGQYNSKGGWENFLTKTVVPDLERWEASQKAVIDLNKVVAPAPASA